MNIKYLWDDKAPYETDLRPSIECHELANAKSAILVCPGGGYAMKAIYHEGADICKLYNEAGYSAFMLDYRVAPCHWEAPLADAKRAMRIVRSMGYEKIGIIGFSAGGNLVCCASVHFDYGDPNASDPIERFSSRPDALISCYSVVSFGKYTHVGSRECLLGERKDEILLWNRFSAELHVRPDSPHAFIWHTAEDAAVPVENSLLLASAYATQAVPFELHIFPRGPHGIGLGLEYEGANKWGGLMLDWLKREGF